MTSMNRRNKFVTTGCLLATFVYFFAAPGKAATLVGTIVTSQVETIGEINDLIADFNADFGSSLPAVTTLLDKLEGQDDADFEAGNLQLSDFKFYQQDDVGGTAINIFDASVNFTSSALGVAAGFDTLDQRVLAFEQLSGPAIDYYVSKDGSLGWSLWVAGPAINPVYTDAGSGVSSISGTGFTRGNTNNAALDYDPITRAVSHISFYRASSHVEVPEPASAVAALLLAGTACIGRWERRRRRH